MNAHVQQASILSGRHMTFVGVIALHALFIAALIAIKVVPPIINSGPDSIEVVPVDPPEVPPPPENPQPRPVDIKNLEFIVPPLDITIDDSELPPEGIKVAVATGPVEPVGPGAGTGPDIVAPPARVSTDLQYRAVKSPDEFYPPSSVSLQEHGVAIVRVCVDGAGRIAGVPTIQTTSGYKRLDQAAIRWAREALRFTPATENGVGVSACKGFRVLFNLN